MAALTWWKFLLFARDARPPAQAMAQWLAGVELVSAFGEEPAATVTGLPKSEEVCGDILMGTREAFFAGFRMLSRAGVWFLVKAFEPREIQFSWCEFH